MFLNLDWKIVDGDIYILSNGGSWYWGADGSGFDQKFFGDTSGAFAFWDASADALIFDKADLKFGDTDFLIFGDGSDITMNWDGTNFELESAAAASNFLIGATSKLMNTTLKGTFTVGVDDTGHDVKFFGATAGSYWLWDESADGVVQIGTLTVGVDGTGHDVKFFGDTASAYMLWDESADALLLAGDARIDLSSLTVAAANTDGGVIKCGTSGARVTEDTANMKFMAFYFDNGATSGDNRGMYLRQYLTGAGGGGEAARIFTTVEDVAGGTAHGAHISLNFGSTGSITGLGVGNRNTVHVPDAALSGGTYAAHQAEIYADGSSSDISGATKYSLFRAIIDGDATGKANAEDNANLFEINTGSNASGNLVSAAGNEPTWASNTYLIRVDLNGQEAYLVAVKT